MTHEMPEHLPELPEGWVYAGMGEQAPRWGSCLFLDDAHPDNWKYGPTCNQNSHQHYAVTTDSDLGRKILAERGKPSWDSAPDWAEWLAQDEDGGWWFYSDRPESDAWRDEWQKTCSLNRLVSSGPSNRHWHTTLERRPESNESDTETLTFKVDASGMHEAVLKAIHDGKMDGYLPDLQIPAGIISRLDALPIVESARRAGYRVEWGSKGIRGWKED